MIGLKLTEQQVGNIKVCILRTIKLSDVDENSMIALLNLSREIDNQVISQTQEKNNPNVKLITDKE